MSIPNQNSSNKPNINQMKHPTYAQKKCNQAIVIYLL